MEKVKLTREQAEAIDKIIEFAHGNKEAIINGHKCDWEQAKFKPLNQMTVAKIAKALYIGYEVEETFEVGDWVFDRDSIYKIISKHHADDLNKGVYSKARHATPEEIAEEKQRRWWAKHGRKVWELKDLDILINEKTRKMYEVDILKDETIRLWKIGVDGAFASDYKSAKEISKNVEVFCFAEDRKDNA